MGMDLTAFVLCGVVIGSGLAPLRRRGARPPGRRPAADRRPVRDGAAALEVPNA
jgi:hypothetical protein